MMNYEIFKEVVKEKFLGYMSDEYKDRELIIQSVDKVNETLDGLTLRDTTSALSISPTIYINDINNNLEPSKMREIIEIAVLENSLPD